jgi:hypothetical protein
LKVVKVDQIGELRVLGWAVMFWKEWQGLKSVIFNANTWNV